MVFIFRGVIMGLIFAVAFFTVAGPGCASESVIAFEMLSRSCAQCPQCLVKKREMAEEARKKKAMYDAMMSRSKELAAQLDAKDRQMMAGRMQSAEHGIQRHYKEEMDEAELGLNCARCAAFKAKCIENLDSLAGSVKYIPLSNYSADDLKRYLEYAHMAEEAYGGEGARTSQIVKTSAGNHILITSNAEGDVIIAFKGTTMLPTGREAAVLVPMAAAEFLIKWKIPRLIKPYAQNVPSLTAQYYKNTESGKDWTANVAQFTGTIPKQYEEAIKVVSYVVESLPPDRRITIVGHSKGGGEALFASVAASFSASSPDMVSRINTVVFNPALINDMNWVKLINRSASEKGMAAIASRLALQSEFMAISMDGDPVSMGTLADPNPTNSPGALLVEEQLERCILKPTGPPGSVLDLHDLNKVLMELSQLVMANRGGSGQCAGCLKYVRALIAFVKYEELLGEH